MHKLLKSVLSSKPGKNQPKNLKAKFSYIYANNIFGGRESRSGEGSNLVQTAVIQQELPQLVNELKINTVMDAPCGDWHWMKNISLGAEKYIGVDIVEALIEKNLKQFGNARYQFKCKNLTEDELPQVDLILCRDCLVHLNFDDACKILANFKRSKSRYLLTTTFVRRDHNNDLVGQNSFWRPLNLELPPFYFPPPLKLINEGCTEENGQFTDKSLGLWRLEDITP